MNKSRAAQRAFNDLIQIEWHEDLDKTRSHIGLMHEFLRRSALWAQELDCKKEWPFFDIVLHINPHLRADALLCEQLDQHLAHNRIGLVMRQCMINHLHWSELAECDPNIPRLTLLPAPYEPLVIMFKQGGSFWLDSIAIVVGVTSVPRKPFSECLSLPALENLNDVIKQGGAQ
ncbi:MAG: hypothetical protein OHK0022_46390 [Roseiflexaceae bacterium]